MEIINYFMKLGHTLPYLKKNKVDNYFFEKWKIVERNLQERNCSYCKVSHALEVRIQRDLFLYRLRLDFSGLLNKSLKLKRS